MLSKHHRFADMPLHNHDFIEMNYMYSGKCRQMIDGKEIGLEQGQICIIDTHVPHSIYALGENDILVNLHIEYKFPMNHLAPLATIV
ncbi:AraC family ligand binding domain-containing protein [Paenibacillus farraposensis]|uniref:AraC family ligand binding domain-containing protein n=1 Tax=Paenibacillus farraposensis TaxID=2807095 RepID=A0ABW4D5D3_9BACL|nr:AraC family ligand binding domain-containing protein [Paenibacillus farraposensis]MCC3378225.1 AraC family ligand binding domain-containing protein [Paenibacillus farraposensis]